MNKPHAMTKPGMERLVRVFKRMPAMIKIGALSSPLFGGAWILLTVMTLLGLSTGSANAEISVGDLALTQRDPVALIFVGVVLATAWGFWTERLWARQTAVGYWALMTALGVGGLASARTTVWDVLVVASIAGLAAWYFFRKNAVVAYYADLREREAAARNMESKSAHQAPNEH
jgi:hypothetical protein